MTHGALRSVLSAAALLTIALLAAEATVHVLPAAGGRAISVAGAQ